MTTPKPLAARLPVVTWAATAATAPNAMPAAAQLRPKARAPAAGRPGADQGAGGHQAEHDAGAEGQGEGGGERGVAADDAGAEQLEAARRLLGPGVADGHDDHEHGDHRRPEGGELDEREGAERGRVVDPAVEGDE